MRIVPLKRSAKTPLPRSEGCGKGLQAVLVVYLTYPYNWGAMAVCCKHAKTQLAMCSSPEAADIAGTRLFQLVLL